MFNGGKFRREIAPAIKAFIREHDHEVGYHRGTAVAVPAWHGAERRRSNGKVRSRPTGRPPHRPTTAKSA
ncbi:MAG: hypothetical protein VW405_07270 [Rhodospirillaceae bacterium]